MVTFNHSLTPGGFSKWFQNVVLYDVYENVQYATFSARHTGEITNVTACMVAGAKCQSLEEFRSLTASYMSQ
ncbi:MAG: hypothetical protein H6Q86_6042 [candidate division NC10 bacterium]|nr:hypothetical protein [candidate division NC10 bacterium]